MQFLLEEAQQFTEWYGVEKGFLLAKPDPQKASPGHRAVWFVWLSQASIKAGTVLASQPLGSMCHLAVCLVLAWCLTV